MTSISSTCCYVGQVGGTHPPITEIQCVTPRKEPLNLRTGKFGGFANGASNPLLICGSFIRRLACIEEGA